MTSLSRWTVCGAAPSVCGLGRSDFIRAIRAGVLLALRNDPDAIRAGVRRAETKVIEIEVKVRDLHRMREALLMLTAACDRHGPGGT
jgi:hypothetical protein